MSSDILGRRLDAESRRSQLLDAGLHLMKEIPLDQLTADDLARAVGVSKGLVFHYFPSTRELHAAVLDAATAELIAGLDPGPDVPPAERLRLGIDSFIAYVEQAPDSYVAMARSAGSDPVLNAVLDRTRDQVVGLVQSVFGLSELPPGLAIGLRGWIAFAEEAALHWLAHDRPVPRDALVSLIQQTAVRLLPEALAMEARQ